MKAPRLLSWQLLRDESAQELYEYALILAVLALAVVASMRSVQTSIVNIFTNVTSNL